MLVGCVQMGGSACGCALLSEVYPAGKLSYTLLVVSILDIVYGCHL